MGIAVADLEDGPITSTFGDGKPYAWSTSKLLIIAQTLKDAQASGGLSEADQANIAAALSRSDNDAALTLNNHLKARYGGMPGTTAVLTDMLRSIGDTTTFVKIGADEQSNYGHTEWQVDDQVRFMRALAQGCLLDSDSTEYLLTAMGSVEAWQSWGLGSVASPAFKGGWGDDFGTGRYLVRQVGLVPALDGNLYAVAVTSRAPDGTFESGQQLNTEVAQWVSSKVQTAPSKRACSS